MISRNISLVLSSGGARGMAHIGAIQEILALGLNIRNVSGSSVGALVGGILASGQLQAFSEWMCQLEKIDVFRLMDFTFSAQGFIKGDKVFNELRNFLSNKAIEDLRLPFAAVATDRRRKTPVIFREGDLFQAIRASVAIPTVLQPAKIGERLLLDGGILSPIPLNLFHPIPGDITVVVNLNANIPYQAVKIDEEQVRRSEYVHNKIIIPFKERWRNYFPENEKNNSAKMGFFDLINRSYDLTQDQLSDYMLRTHRPEVVVQVSRETCGTLEFHRAHELIEVGRHAFRTAWQDYERRAKLGEESRESTALSKEVRHKVKKHKQLNN